MQLRHLLLDRVTTLYDIIGYDFLIIKTMVLFSFFYDGCKTAYSLNIRPGLTFEENR